MPKPELNAVITHRSDLKPGLAIFRLRPEGWELPAFRAGQYAMISLPGSLPRHPDAVAEERPLADDRWVKKAYSISSAASDHPDEIELYVVMVPNGQLTPRLFALGEGDRVHLLPRMLGDFFLETPADARVALIGTGTGLAPYLSMVRSHLGSEETRRFAVFHGVRTSDELGFRAELESRADADDRLTYLPCIDQPENDPDWAGLRGWAQEHWTNGTFAEALGGAPSPADTHVYLCGNPLMVDAMKDLLLPEGYALHSRRAPEGQIHVESFW